MLSMVVFFLIRGYSLGDDLPFHLGSWQAASRSLRHGVYPQWDAAAALGAGEPRFVFYPPLSWLLGALLRTFASPTHAAEWFVCAAVAGCWLAMYAATRRWASVSTALLAATFYAAAPYTLFNSLQRAAFGELLAAVWLPMLFAACIAPTLAAVAIPLALVWLTNIPTGIAASYLLLFVALFRLLRMLWQRTPARVVVQQAAVFAGGAALGLLLISFFLLPALVQSKDVQLAAAFEHGQSFRDNFLLRHTALTSRQTLHTVTAMVVAYLCVLLCVLIAMAVLRRRHSRAHPGWLPALLIALACVLVFLMLPPSAPVWQHLPKLAVLQFPWRFMSVLTLVLAYAVALLVDTIRMRRWQAVLASVVIGAALVSTGASTYWRDPQQLDERGLRRANGAASTQRRPTQEYTPAGASNTGLQRMDVPSCSPASDAEAEAISAYPLQWRFHLQRPATCTLPLRNYTRWTVTVQGQAATPVTRHDGRIVLHLPAGDSAVQVRWHRGWDYFTGLAASAAALFTLLLLTARRKQQT